MLTLKILKYHSKAIEVNAVVFEYYDSQLYNDFARDFNKYAEEHNLDITFKVTCFSNNNSTVHSTGDSITIHSLLEKKTKKYDIFFYTVTHVPDFDNHLMDLKGHIPQDIIDLYNSRVFNKTAYIKGRLVGFPINMSCSILYSNVELLKKYNRTVPETWDEFFDTAKYILTKERNLNNTRLVALGGIFNDDEKGSNSLYEMLFSYRKSIELDYPDITSEEAKKSFEMLKKIKDELSSDEEFQRGESYLYENMYTGNAIFIKYYFIGPIHPSYKVGIIPGAKKGISASNLGGPSVGINIHSDEDKKMAAVEVLKFILSKEVQKKSIIKHHAFSGIKELYSDEELCSQFPYCELFKNVQLFTRYQFLRPDYVKFSTQFRHYAYEYLYGNKSVTEVLNKINDMTRIYYFTISTEDSAVGLVYFIMLTIFSIMILSNLFFCTSEKYKLMKVLILLIILTLCFLEWNLEETLYDIRLLTSAIYTNEILAILIAILNLIAKNKHNTYMLHDQKNIEESKILSYLKYRNHLYTSTTIKSEEQSNGKCCSENIPSSSSSSIKNRITKLINYHYQKSLDSVVNANKFSDMNIPSSYISSSKG
ncbi:hypothetical protein PIROE2DRAFT_9645 [Piromyces sp. E2]|nr:hypothetical protein PIROE2DRAFT_9645 [Piromyces sp. E2]|eukprot:OUM63780.1 hypothetical protein PIROE2DRAFT_9645 [Piromyces sp. E2]